MKLRSFLTRRPRLLCFLGYCGADIRAVCTEAVLCALRRRYPQIYATSHKLQLDVSSIRISACDFTSAMSAMRPCAHRAAAPPARPLAAAVRPLLGTTLDRVLDRLRRLFPHVEQAAETQREAGENACGSCYRPARPMLRAPEKSHCSEWFSNCNMCLLHHYNLEIIIITVH